MSTIVILTALEEELKPVVARLSNLSPIRDKTTGTIYSEGFLSVGSRKLRIVVGKTDQSNTVAAIETERVIRNFSPSHIFFCGVAGGLKDVAIGDVVIGASVYGYEKGKAVSEFLPRPQFGFSSYSLEKEAMEFSKSSEWIARAEEICNKKFQPKVLTFSGTIASGEKVAASMKSQLVAFLKKNCSHALAVETEGLGFLEACRHYPLIKTLLIRSISDLIDAKSESDKSGSQQYASDIAAEFLFGLLRFLDLKTLNQPLSIKQQLIEIMPKLYPTGLRENEVWTRAGGDLSVVNLYTNGRTQWVQSLGLIELGGGGAITFSSLIDEIRKDFPNNNNLESLHSG